MPVQAWACGSPLLKPAARHVLESADQVYVLAASIREVAVIARFGKIQADPYELAEAIAASGFVELAVRSAHAARVARLALHHNDPFDRLLIAQAIAEPFRP